MFDLKAYYTFELKRIALSSGASDEVRQAIKAELVLRDVDSHRGLEYSSVNSVRPLGQTRIETAVAVRKRTKTK